MDPVLIDYLKSGSAWVLVGSGPSIECGYPSWEGLAQTAVATCRLEQRDSDLAAVEAAAKERDFPRAFEQSKAILGGPRLLQALAPTLRSTRAGGIYEQIARWPVDVYLTTNFDNAIQESLARLGVAYSVYGNTPDHMGYLTPDLRGAIVKLHGDLRSEEGLILTQDQYQAIQSGAEWEHWRKRMHSVFQMVKLVVVGHSLSDQHVKHLLAAAKGGASVGQPICWLAPDVTSDEAREYLHRDRIRVISYPNPSGDHSALLRLLRSISQFVPPRTAIGVSRPVADAASSPLGKDAAAPGFFVFNKLATRPDSDERRLDVALAAVEAVSEQLVRAGEFSIDYALVLAGWPKESLPGAPFLAEVIERGLSRELLERSGDRFRIAQSAAADAERRLREFEEMRDRFRQSVSLRVNRSYPSLTLLDCREIAADVEASLTGFFRQGGLTLATTLFSQKAQPKGVLPSSIVGFMSEAAARYNDLLRRQAFFDASLEAFTKPEVAERDYLGRVSQGFFAFHALGVFGEVALERIREAKDTVWLVDSHVQIPAIALAAPLNHLFRATLSSLAASGVRLFTTRTLFEETREHFWFADHLVQRTGSRSIDVMQAAVGETPYRKSNQFLQGFVAWSAANAGDWDSYLYQAFGQRRVSAPELEAVLNGIGIEVVDFQGWPGFLQQHFADRDSCVGRISKLRERLRPGPLSPEDLEEIRRKALPEAEALLVVEHERAGTYHILEEGVGSRAWFVSETSVLNSVEAGHKVTWQPEAFLRFVSTLAPAQGPAAADAAFETILWSIARTGLSMVDPKAVEVVFGGIVDAAAVTLEEQKQLYHETLEVKYGAPADVVLERVSPRIRPLAAVQLLRELLERQASAQLVERAALQTAVRRAKEAERQLKDVESLRRKMQAKKERAKRKKRQAPPRKAKKVRRK